MISYLGEKCGQAVVLCVSKEVDLLQAGAHFVDHAPIALLNY